MKTKRNLIASAMSLAFIALCVSAAFAEKREPTYMTVTERRTEIKARTASSDYATEQVRLQLNRTDCVFEEGEKVEITVESSKSGYLYLICLPEEEDAILLLPNKYTDDVLRIEKGKPVTYPSKSDRFDYVVYLPKNQKVSNETFMAFVTDEPLDMEKALRNTSKEAITDLTGEPFKQFVQELDNKGVDIRERVEEEGDTSAANDLIRGEINYQIVEKNVRTQEQPKRFACCFAISDYYNKYIPDLPACRVDLEGFKDVSVKRLGVASGDVRTQLNPTKEDVRKTIENLANVTKPNDTIFIYWSGHGYRGSDDTTYLVPSKSDPMDPVKTMISDTEFGNWLEKLQDRQFFVFIDTCHAAGMVENAKDLGSKAIGLPLPDDEFEFNFDLFKNRASFDANSKAIRQGNSYVLCSCAADQKSYIITADPKKGSVATYCLLQVLNNSSNDRITQKELQREVKKGVDDYFKNEGQGRGQKILVQDRIDSKVLLIKR